MRNAIFSKRFLRSLFWVQNEWHRHGVLVHTLKVVYHAMRKGYWDLVIPALWHDIGKPFVANQRKQEDQQKNLYSFDNHEEFGFHLIKRCPLLSQRSKIIVRYHYLLRGMMLSEKRNQVNKHKRLVRIWSGLTPELQEDLRRFLVVDDLAK